MQQMFSTGVVTGGGREKGGGVDGAVALSGTMQPKERHIEVSTNLVYHSVYKKVQKGKPTKIIPAYFFLVWHSYKQNHILYS